jgi:hypothetical protein
MLQIKSFLLLLMLLPLSARAEPLVDAVVMSYDRPLQLWATLESLEKYCTGINTIHVLLRTSDERFAAAYEKLIERFPSVIVHHQSNSHPQKDFKSLFLNATFGKSSPSPYVLFIVDDIIVTDYIDLNQCIRKKEHYKAWGFFLRLGKNITHTFVRTLRPTPPPKKGHNIENRCFLWHFHSCQGDWAYPNNLDMTLYRKDDIKRTLKRLSYSNPTNLEQKWYRTRTGKEIGLSFESSKLINLPLNKVANLENRTIPGFSTELLLEKFLQGFRLDISPFFQVQNSSCHVEMYPQFIYYKAQKGTL